MCHVQFSIQITVEAGKLPQLSTWNQRKERTKSTTLKPCGTSRGYEGRERLCLKSQPYPLADYGGIQGKLTSQNLRFSIS